MWQLSEMITSFGMYVVGVRVRRRELENSDHFRNLFLDSFGFPGVTCCLCVSLLPWLPGGVVWMEPTARPLACPPPLNKALAYCNAFAKQESGLPWMTDKRWEDDTLFLLFEEDFRFTNVAARDDVESGLVHATPPVAKAGKGSWFTAAEANRSAERSTTSGRVTGVQYELPESYAAVDMPAPSQILSDCVRYATAANRRGLGNLIWCGWMPTDPSISLTPKKPNRLGMGTQFLMLTRLGAKVLLDAMHTDVSSEFHLHRGHWDQSLRKWLYKHHNLLQSSFLLPPMGGYYEHPSGCDLRLSAGRPTPWDAPWCCPGTRREDDPQDREKWLCTWTKKGGTEWDTRIDQVAGDVEYNWRTCFYDHSSEYYNIPSRMMTPFMRHEPTAMQPHAHLSSQSASSSSGVQNISPAYPRDPVNIYMPAAADSGSAVVDTKRQRRLQSQAQRLRDFRNTVADETQAWVTSVIVVVGPRSRYLALRSFHFKCFAEC